MSSPLLCFVFSFSNRRYIQVVIRMTARRNMGTYLFTMCCIPLGSAPPFAFILTRFLSKMYILPFTGNMHVHVLLPGVSGKTVAWILVLVFCVQQVQTKCKFTSKAVVCGSTSMLNAQAHCEITEARSIISVSVSQQISLTHCHKSSEVFSTFEIEQILDSLTILFGSEIGAEQIFLYVIDQGFLQLL